MSLSTSLYKMTVPSFCWKNNCLPLKEVSLLLKVLDLFVALSAAFFHLAPFISEGLLCFELFDGIFIVTKDDLLLLFSHKYFTLTTKTERFLALPTCSLLPISFHCLSYERGFREWLIFIDTITSPHFIPQMCCIGFLS